MKKTIIFFFTFATVTAAAQTQTVKTIPATDTLRIGFLDKVEVTFADVKHIQMEQHILVLHPSSEKISSALLSAGRYDIQYKDKTVSHTARRSMPVTSGGVDVDEIILIRITAPKGTIIE